MIFAAQTIIENPETPISKNAGRKTELREVMQIKDVGGDYYFMYPRNLKIAPDESIFIEDKEQLLQFDKNGKFVRNIFKKGQGPGEMGLIRNYCFSNGNVIVFNASPSKIICINDNGTLIKEFTIQPSGSSLKFLTVYNGIHYFFGTDYPRFKRGQSDIVDIPQSLISFSQDENEMEKLTAFPTKVYIVASKQGGQAMCPVNSLIAVPYRKKFVFICHTQEYLVKLYDFEKKQTIRQFKRKYKRVKIPKGEEKKCGAMIDGEEIILPNQIYLDDVQNLFVSGNQLWVMTSTLDRDNRILIDVYNLEGQYINNFYLRFPDNFANESYGYKPMTVSGDFLYTIEQNIDGNYMIKKYKIEDAMH